MVPTSLFAYITLIKIVCGVIARAMSSGLTPPCRLTGTRVTAQPNSRSSCAAVLRIAWCSMGVMMRCGCAPCARVASATPRKARLSLSDPPEVKTISFGRAFKIPATVRRDCSSVASAACPYRCKLDALPNCSVKYGNMASTTRGSTGVVAE